MEFETHQITEVKNSLSTLKLNSLLVPFGKHICTGALPRCSECPVLTYCQQVGAQTHR